MRCFLDPAQAHAKFIPSVHGDLPTKRPPSLRAFGYYPPHSAFKRGDLLLFSPKYPLITSRLIMKDQRRYFAEDHARWTHAAVYAIDGKIVESTPMNGIAMALLHNYIPTHDILVRRHLTISDDQRADIAADALSRINTGYPIFNLAFYMVRESINLLKPFDRDTYSVCSGLFAGSYMRATGNALQGCPPGELVRPAELSLTDTLSDVDIPWMRLD
jgi:uncharacterized protein YycO